MFDNSTNPQEIMEVALKLGMEPFTLQEATEAAERHARIMARRTAQNEAEKVELPWTEEELGDMIMSYILDEPPKNGENK